MMKKKHEKRVMEKRIEKSFSVFSFSMVKTFLADSQHLRKRLWKCMQLFHNFQLHLKRFF